MLFEGLHNMSVLLLFIEGQQVLRYKVPIHDNLGHYLSGMSSH